MKVMSTGDLISICKLDGDCVCGDNKKESSSEGGWDALALVAFYSNDGIYQNSKSGEVWSSNDSSMEQAHC